jgi:membrane-anchored glycerophosphoryl diester phosphodiesterase (GDPDase)
MPAMVDQPPADATITGAAFRGPPPASPERPLPLRQMGIGELIDGSIKLYRRDWLALMGIVAFVLVPVTFVEAVVAQNVLGSAFESPFPSQETANQLVIVSVVFLAVQFLIVQPFLIAAVARAAADAYLGERVTIGRTYRFALSRLPAILWITILSSVLTIIGFILLIIPGIIIAIRLALAPPVFVVEDVRGTKAIGRSWRLTAGHTWRVLGTLVLSGLIATIGASIITIPTEFIAQSMGPDGWLVSTFGSTLASVLIEPFSMLIVVLLYFDLRVRKEGYDIEVMARELAPAS